MSWFSSEKPVGAAPSQPEEIKWCVATAEEPPETTPKYNLSLGRSNGAAPVPAAGLPELKNVVDPPLADPK